MNRSIVPKICTERIEQKYVQKKRVQLRYTELLTTNKYRNLLTLNYNRCIRYVIVSAINNRTQYQLRAKLIYN